MCIGGPNARSKKPIPLILENHFVPAPDKILVPLFIGHFGVGFGAKAAVRHLWFAKTRSAFKGLNLAKLDDESISHRNPLNNSLFGLTTPV